MNQQTQLADEFKSKLLELMFLQNEQLKLENAMLRDINQLNKKNSIIYQALESIKGG